ncbi:hypothetical protein BGX38DRAFT_1274128 [Terfezia claveryi]|nr:hypothetical protein BGX38DRAFT_1274128 [Terfezia claveryi]
MDMYAEGGGFNLWTCLPIAPQTSKELTEMDQHNPPPLPLQPHLHYSPSTPLLQLHQYDTFPHRHQRPMSPEPSSGHDIQATNVQALVAAQAQAQAMREFLGALELSQLTGAPPPVFYEFFNMLPPQLQNILLPIDPALFSNTPSRVSPGPEFKHPKFKSKQGTNIQPKPKSLVYLILPSSCFEDRREVPALPQGYMPVSEDNEEPELIHRTPESDELDWNYLSKLSESQRLAIRSGYNPDDHAEVCAHRRYVYQCAYDNSFFLRQP